MTILDPDRHRSGVDFLDNAEAPQFDVAVAGEDQAIAVIDGARTVVLSSHVLAVEHCVAERVPTLTDTTFDVEGVVRETVPIEDVLSFTSRWPYAP